MKTKDMLSLSMPDVEIASRNLAADSGSAGMHLSNLMAKLAQYFRGGQAAPRTPDPALAIINQIQDTQVRTMVRDLHFLTPPSLKTMREACEECFFLPEDCSYVDYSIPDVKKAIRKINSHPELAAAPGMVIRELAKVNPELAQHLQEHFDLQEELQ